MAARQSGQGGPVRQLVVASRGGSRLVRSTRLMVNASDAWMCPALCAMCGPARISDWIL